MEIIIVFKANPHAGVGCKRLCTGIVTLAPNPNCEVGLDVQEVLVGRLAVFLSTEKQLVQGTIKTRRILMHNHRLTSSQFFVGFTKKTACDNFFKLCIQRINVRL